MNTRVLKLNRLSLAIQDTSVPSLSAPSPIHHLVAIDISGSMHSSLAGLRQHLKNKLASLVGPQDLVSIVWFSGKGQVGVLVEGMAVASVGDLGMLHNAIDRFLVPLGLTGFKEPLEMAKTLIQRYKTSHPSHLANLMFFSDGADNQWSKKEILALCQALEPILDSAAVVEYGWYCDRPLMRDMAEAMGGSLVFSEDFPSYVATFEGSLSGSTKKTRVKLVHPGTKGYAFALHKGNVLSFSIGADNTVLIPEGVTQLAYVCEAQGAVFDYKKDKDALIWASLVPFSQKMDTDAVLSVLKSLGDVRLVELFGNCFSKEDYNIFQAEALSAALDEQLRYVDGYSKNAVPKDDAFTVIDLLDELSSSDENLFYPYHESFEYERISAATEAKEKGAKFHILDKSTGYPINGLVWNENRPNVSLRVMVPGTVSLPADKPANIPPALNSHIYRNYTIIKDGIVHTRVLPVSLSEDSFNKLKAVGLLKREAYSKGKVYQLSFKKIPVINRNMVKSVTAKDTFDLAVQMEQLAGTQKVFNDLQKEVAPKTSSMFEALYGAEGTQYLKDIGLTEYNGFSPSSVTVKSGDHYMAKELKIAVKGLSSLPKVTDARKAFEEHVRSARKLKINEFVMTDAIKKIDDFVNSPLYKSAADPTALMKTWVASEAKAVTQRVRALTLQMAKRKFAIVIGQSWFSDFGSLEENTLEVEVPGFGRVPVTATLKEVEVAL